MNPNETLRDLLGLMRQIESFEDTATPAELEIMENFNALHEWLSKGGFLPAMWTKNRQQDGYDKIVIVEE